MSGLISLESNELSVLESSGQIQVPIVREGDLSQPVTIEFSTSAGTASSADFTGVTGTITMAAGQARALVTINITDDALSEDTEGFTLSLINVTSGSLSAPRTTQIDILDDENPVRDPANPPLESNFDVNAQDLFGGISQPIAFEFSPNDSSLMYVAEKGGRIRLFDYTTGEDRGDLVDLRAEVNNRQDRGLMDIALHPDLENNPYLYAFVVVDPPETAGQSGNAGADGGGNRYSHVLRFTLDESDGFQSIVPGSKTVLLGGAGQSLSDISGNGAVDSTSNIGQPASDIDPNTGEFIEDYIKVDSRSHAGGALEFGPDGALYISTGDGTSFNTVDPRTVGVQDVNSLAGKILRVDPITGEGLSDNPFFTGDSDANASKVYQLGLRNPFSMSFDDEGQLIITDTGWFSWEELNAGGPGANFGWPFFEGGDNGDSVPAPRYRDLPEAAAFYDAVDAGEIEITPPFRAFSHNGSAPGFQVQAITGADDLIDSDLYPEALQGYYIFTDVSQGEVFAINRNDQRDVEYLYTDNNGFGPVHFKQGPDGVMYYADIRSGQIGRLDISDPNGPQPDGAIQAEYFAIASSTTQLSDVDFDAAPIFTETVSRIDEGGAGGFYPGGPADDFAARYTTQFTVDEGADYTFFLTSDDGSQLRVDGQLVINNDGLQPATEETGTIALAPGTYSLEVLYFERGGNTRLDLDWDEGGGVRTQFVQFADDGPGEPTQEGTPGSDLLNGTDGDDVIDGLGGGDFFFGSLGNDTLIGTAGAYDQVDYAGGRGDYTFTQNADGTVTVTGALIDADTLVEIDGFWFQGQQEWFAISELVAPVGGGDIVGTSGDDVLNGTIADDTMIGNGGSDQFQESLGDDTIIGNASAYSQVNYFGEVADYTFSENADGTVTVINAETGTDTLTDIDGFWFNGSQTWLPIESVLVPSGGDIVGTSGDDLLNGTLADDTMIGNGGSDQFQESLGDDTIIGDAGVYDQVNYFGFVEEYTFTQNADGTVTVVNDETGTDTLTEIDGFWFNDSQLWLPIEDVLAPGAAASASGPAVFDDSGARVSTDMSALDQVALAPLALPEPSDALVTLITDPMDMGLVDDMVA